MSRAEDSPEQLESCTVMTQIQEALEELYYGSSDHPYGEVLLQDDLHYEAFSVVGHFDPDGLEAIYFLVKRTESYRDRYEFARDSQGSFAFQQVKVFHDSNGKTEEVLGESKLTESLTFALKLFTEHCIATERSAILEGSLSVDQDYKRRRIYKKIQRHIEISRSTFGKALELVDDTIEP